MEMLSLEHIVGDDHIADRFAAKVAEPDEHGCRLWLGPLRGKGSYGTFWVPSPTEQNVAAHRVAWVLAAGHDIPVGQVIDHLCREHRCVAPEHLRAIAPYENSTAPGSKHWTRHYLMRERCDRGHRLVPANITLWARARGYRLCRSCQYAIDRKHAGCRSCLPPHRWTEEMLQVEADRKYRELVAEDAQLAFF